MARITNKRAEYIYKRHVKKADHKQRSVHKIRRRSCRLGFHRPYNMIGWPMVEVPLRCWYCEIPLEYSDYSFAARLSRFFLSFIGKDHLCKMIKVYSVDKVLDTYECDIVGCTHKEYLNKKRKRTLWNKIKMHLKPNSKKQLCLAQSDL